VAHLARGSSARKRSIRSPIPSHRETILLYGARGTSLYDASIDGAGVTPKGILLGPKATPEELAEAFLVYLRGVCGFRPGRALLKPLLTVARRRLGRRA
jgi:hypothetical protein